MFVTAIVAPIAALCRQPHEVMVNFPRPINHRRLDQLALFIQKTGICLEQCNQLFVKAFWHVDLLSKNHHAKFPIACKSFATSMT